MSEPNNKLLSSSSTLTSEPPMDHSINPPLISNDSTTPVPTTTTGTPTSTPTPTNTTTTTSETKTIKSSSELLNDSKIIAILNSDSSLELLLKRLKQSIKANDEFTQYLKRKHNYEENYIRDMKRISSNCKNSIKSNTNTKLLKNSFIESLDKIISFDDKIVVDVRTPYLKALEKMCEELSSLSSNFSRLRKLAKDDGQRKEKEVQDLIILAEKSKTRYNSLCSDLEKLRNSDQSQKKITLQGRKTGSQQEEDLIKKIQSADQDYSAKAYASQRAKNDMIKIHRPKLSQKLKNLILELDNALQLQLQKYAAYNESLIIGMGNQIIPLDGNRASMRLISSSVDVEKSLYDYLRGAKIENKSSFIPIEYQKHILFGGGKTPKQRNVPNSFSNNSRLVSNSSTVSSIAAPSTTNVIPQTYVPPSSTTATATTTTTPGMPSSNGNLSNTASVPQPPPLGPTPAYSTLDPARPSTLTGPRALDSPTTTYPEQLVPGDEYAAAALPTTEEVITTSTKGQLFGQPIENVPHDDEMVPYFVKKCISLIETYGINSEGIYRSSPNKLKLEELKQQIDLNPNNLSILDPPDLNNITDDYIFIIASLLKNFFAELPNPLLTNEQSPNFIKCGLIEDLKTMHIQLHRIVFELPDANYFTLRDLLFHFANLNNIPKIRMNVKNLSIVWGNNLLGCEFTTKEELSVQCRVIEELISAAQDIFNPKDE